VTRVALSIVQACGWFLRNSLWGYILTYGAFLIASNREVRLNASLHLILEGRTLQLSPVLLGFFIGKDCRLPAYCRAVFLLAARSQGSAFFVYGPVFLCLACEPVAYRAAVPLGSNHVFQPDVLICSPCPRVGDSLLMRTVYLFPISLGEEPLGPHFPAFVFIAR